MLIKGLRGFVFGIDDQGIGGDLRAGAQAASYRKTQETFSKPLTLAVFVYGQSAHPEAGQRKLRQTAAMTLGELGGINLCSAQRVITKHQRRRIRIDEDINLGQAAPTVLSGELRQVVVEDRYSAVERPAVVHPGIEAQLLKHDV